MINRIPGPDMIAASRPTSLRWCAAFSAVIVVMLFAGLNPRGYNFKNSIQVSPDHPGMQFNRFGVAHTGRVLTPEIAGRLNADGYEMELVLGPQDRQPRGFEVIAGVFSGDDHSQLVVGRWGSQLIVMSGDDFMHRFKLPRLVAWMSDSQIRQGMRIGITSGPYGSAVALDGQVVMERGDLQLRIPSAPNAGRIVLGNSARGSHPWSGVLQEFVLRTPEPTLVPLISFPLGRLDGPGMNNAGSLACTLQLPEHSVVVEPAVLTQPFDAYFRVSSDFVGDVILNLFGFIPFGLLLSWWLRSRGAWYAVLVTGVVSLMFSLMIEMVQVWIPTRTSSVLDLVLNTLGGGFGGTLYFLVIRVVEKRRTAG